MEKIGPDPPLDIENFLDPPIDKIRSALTGYKWFNFYSSYLSVLEFNQNMSLSLPNLRLSFAGLEVSEISSVVKKVLSLSMITFVLVPTPKPPKIWH